MYQIEAKRAARRRRTKALLLTIAFHLALILVLAGSTSSELGDLLPDFIREVLGRRPPAPEQPLP